MKKASVFSKSLSVMLVIAMMLAMLVSGISVTHAKPPEAAGSAKIISFEQSGVVFEKTVEIGTLWEDLELPTELRAVFEEEIDAIDTIELTTIEIPFNETPTEETLVIQDSSFRSSNIDDEESRDAVIRNSESGILNEENKPEVNVSESNEPESNELEENEPEDNELEGNKPEETEPEETEPEEIATHVLSIPVTWEGYFDGNEPGEYILTAKIEGYSYKGEMPTAVITVEGMLAPMGGPQRSPPLGADYIIDIGGLITPVTPTNTLRDGYKLVGTTSRTLTFAAQANGYTYEVIQTANTTGFWTFEIPDGVSLTIILSDIGVGFNDLSFYIQMHGNADLQLRLRGVNVISQGYFIVRDDTKLTIDSADSPGTTNGSLSISSGHNENAVIGGFYNYSSSTSTVRHDSGLITINGGTITATQSGTAEKFGAVIGGGRTTNGTIVINGGNVTATAAGGTRGAAIGGGFNGKGTVEINGGSVTATVPIGSYGTGAAIGGGEGSGNDTTGRGDVIITGGTVTATARTGAAIGGGMRSANAAILITGGTIVATSNHSAGAAIGSGGGSTGFGAHLAGGVLDVTITGGDLTLTTWLGAAVGHGGYEGASVTNHNPAVSGSVTITGGRIYADVNEGSGIGTGLNNKVVPNLFIDTGADILVFGRKRSAFAGIYAGDKAVHQDGVNQGNGYYVNINFPDPSNTTNPTLLDNAPIKAGTKIIVTTYGSSLETFKMLTVPHDIGMLSFTTGRSSSQDFNLYVGTSSGYKQFAHPSYPSPDPRQTDPALIVYNDARIYSVKRTYDYDDNGHIHDNYFRSLPLKAGVGGGAFYIVDEKYINKAGDSILEDSFTLVSDNGTYGIYDKTISPVTGYVYRGYKWDTKPTIDDLEGIDPSGTQITANRLIYFLYDVYKEVGVTVTKAVKGSQANKLRDFTFTVSFTDSNGVELPAGKTFSYDGGLILGSGAEAAPNGTLTLKQGGWDTFTLKHGQMITINDIPSDVRIKIIETTSEGYTMSYTDSARPGGPYNTDMEFDSVGADARIFEFLNVRDEIVPTDIKSETWALVAFSLLAVTFIIAGLVAAEYQKRKAKN